MRNRWPEALLALWLALAAAPARAIEQPAVMQMLAARGGGEATFTEERTVSTLDSPLRASGTLSFTPPDRFARYTKEPRAESLEVDGNSIVLKRGGRSRQFTLDALPELTALVEALRGTLNGDAQVLQKHFKVAVSGDAGKWVMLLSPLEQRLASQVRSLEIVGQRGDIRSVDLLLAGGDRSLMLVAPLVERKPGPASK